MLNAKGSIIGLLSSVDIAVFAGSCSTELISASKLLVVNLAKTAQSLVTLLGLPVEHPELLNNFDQVPDLFKGDKSLEEAFSVDSTKFVTSMSVGSSHRAHRARLFQEEPHPPAQANCYAVRARPGARDCSKSCCDG